MLLDTHVWIWWVQGDPQLKIEHIAALAEAQAEGIEVSIISCWEIAKLIPLKLNCVGITRILNDLMRRNEFLRSVAFG